MRKFLFRIGLVAAGMLVMVGVFFAALYKLQVEQGDENRKSSRSYT